jgi:hypothetical protein
MHGTAPPPKKASIITSDDPQPLGFGLCFWEDEGEQAATDSWKVVINPNGKAEVECHFSK